jgi:hypothetical protein
MRKNNLLHIMLGAAYKTPVKLIEGTNIAGVAHTANLDVYTLNLWISFLSKIYMDIVTNSMNKKCHVLHTISP